MQNLICPRCRREIVQPQAAFCPFCGARLSAESDATPPEAAALLEKASQQSNNRKKLALLQKAREQFPDCLAVEEEWLFQGKLPQTAAAALDYSGIKCHLLHLYLTPDEFDAQQQSSMRQELFQDPQLLRCLSLSDSPEVFTAHYLERLCREFIQIFLFGSNRYMPRLLGFQLERNAAKVLAKPVAGMLRAMAADEALTQPQRADLQSAMEAAFCAECGGEMRWLRQAMEA